MYRRFTKLWFRYDFIGNPKILYRRTKYFIQRGRRGYDETSHWNVDNYIAKILSGLLYDLANNLHGCPGYGRYVIEEPTSKNDWCGKFDFDRWESDLRHHAEVLSRYDDKYSDLDFYEREVVPTMQWIADYFGSLWD